MPRVPGPLSKGSIFRKLDKYMSNPQQNFVDELRIPANFNLDKLGESRGLLEGQAQRDHTSKEWFGSEDQAAAWWPKNAQKQDIIRQGYIKATELAVASEPSKPVVTYWVNGLENFEVMVAESDAQVTVFLMTPAPPEMAKSNTLPHVDERLWLISTDERLAAIQEDYIAEERPKAVETDSDGVFCMQMRAPK